MSNRLRVYLAAAAFLCAIGLLCLAQIREFSKPQQAKSTPVASLETPTISDSSRAQRRIDPAATQIDSEEIWELNIGGQPLVIAIALDEACFKDADGNETIAQLTPPATLASLPARLAALSAPRGGFPVAYLVGEERSISSRRIVTADLRIQLDDENPEKIASQNQLVIKDRPSYAPNWVVMSARDPFAALEAMVKLRGVQKVASADVLLAVQHSSRALPNDPLVANQWHLKKTSGSSVGTDVNIENIWNYPAATGSRGAGIRIGIVDNGLETTHPDLAANVDTTIDKDWNGGDLNPNPSWGNHHGTACAGSAAARGNNNLGVSGTAPNATLVGMRLTASAVDDSQEADAMIYLSDLIHVKSNSWGPGDSGYTLLGPGPLTELALQSAATNGRDGKGTIFVWAGGNGGENGDNANYDGYANSIYTIAIGATDSTGSRANYSEPGCNIVACAPSGGSLDITTTDRTGSAGYNSAISESGGDYASDFGGTSSAAPTAAGIVALMLEKNPTLGWRDVQEILIKSAFKIKPTDTGWATNGAGISFNHDFGAGLIDATAAVNLAASWSNLPAQINTTSTQTDLNAGIPNNNATGITRTFNLDNSNIRVEQITLKLSATHDARGDLEITLTSPSGMVSKLAAVHSDTGNDYSDWTFSSVHGWGELSNGVWTLKVADLSTTGNSTGGTLTAAELRVYGTPGIPVNPAPTVQITQPANGQFFSPNTSITVQASASDLTLIGGTGVINKVDFFDNGNLIGTDASAPYTFTYTPGLGSHMLVAEATDSESAVGTSLPVDFTVANQSPVITAASLPATGQSYSDVPLTISSITATDPEGAALTYSYQWQSSSNQTTFTNEPGATTATAPALAGNLLRCVITASDGNTSSTAYTTSEVNLLARPSTAAAIGGDYSYTSGLVLRDSVSTISRRAIISEFSQGPAGSNSEWIEILTLETGSLANWDLGNNAGNTLLFLNGPVWDNIPAGTLIVVYNGASKDPILPADDSDPSDGKMVLSSTDPTHFDAAYDAWLPLNNNGDAIFLKDQDEVLIASVAYGNNSVTPNVGDVDNNKSAYYDGNTDEGANLADNWRVTTSLTARSLRSLLPGVTFIGGSYSQNFNITPGSSGTTYPDGWTAYNGSTPVTTMIVGGQTSSAGANYNYGSRIGLLGSKSAFEPSSLVLAFANTTGLSGVSISFDIIKIREQGRSMSFKLQYGTTSATSGFTDVVGGSYTSAAIAEGTSTSFSNITLPSAINNSSSTVYLRWLYTTGSGTGSHDGLALDNVVLHTGAPPSLEGVTPAAANSVTNQFFVTALRNGELDSPSLFRTGAGATIPTGLSLDIDTGTLSGTLAESNLAGNYPIIIERYNSIGEVVSQSYTLTLSGGAGNTYSNWLTNYSLGGLTALNDDPDHDGKPNGIENIFGTAPNAATTGLTQVSTTASALIFRHSRSNTPASDLTTSYEWSNDLVTWQNSAVNHNGTTVTIATAIITDTNAPANDLVEVTAAVSGSAASKIFVRLKVSGL